MAMEIGSSMSAAVAVSQGQARQGVSLSAMAQEAKSQTAMANMLEASAKDNGGSVTETRGRNLNITV